jgi:disulfide bond formation protein DsbB
MVDRTLALPAPRLTVLVLLLVSAIVLGSAYLMQYVGGLDPCELCLYERWPYWAAIAVTLLGLALGGGATRPVVAACAMLFAAGAVLSFYHVGVEQHWFAGPAACTGSGAGAASVEELKRQLMSRQPVNCDEPAWQLFGVSIAGFNLLAQLGILAFCLAALRRGPAR